jgi:chromosome segregation ATPase
MAEENEGLQHVSDNNQTRIFLLEKDLQELTSENYKLVAELKENFKTVSMLKYRNISLENKNKNLEMQLDVLAENNKQQMIDMKNLKGEYHTEMNRIVTQNSEYLRQITDLKEEVDNANKRQSEYQTEIEGIVTQNSEYLRQITDLKEEVDNANIELSIVKKAHASSVPLEQANKEKGGLTSEINVLRKKNSDLTEHVRMLKQRKKDLMSSNSYQIGQIFAKAIAEPGFNTVMMPFKLVRFFVLLLFKRN